MSAGITGHNPHGAGLYGAPSPAQKRCGKCNNGTGIYNPDCSCRRLASQEVPYLSPDAWVGIPEPDYPESPHGPL